MNPVVLILVFAICLLPLPTPARPTTQMLVAHQNRTRRDVDLFFDIAFSLALLFALLGSFTWLVTGRTISQLFASLTRMCASFVAFAQRLSNFRFSSATTADASTANTPRRGGASHPVATVPRGRV